MEQLDIYRIVSMNSSPPSCAHIYFAMSCGCCQRARHKGEPARVNCLNFDLNCLGSWLLSHLDLLYVMCVCVCLSDEAVLPLPVFPFCPPKYVRNVCRDGCVCVCHHWHDLGRLLSCQNTSITFDWLGPGP